MDISEHLSNLGLAIDSVSGDIPVTSPIDGQTIGALQSHTPQAVETAIAQSTTAFKSWRQVPAPQRGELIRLYGEVLRKHKADLGALVSFECGKIYQEGLGEVQEMIDICDFAVGLSRQLYGLTIPSERPSHVMRETYQPMGPVGIISAFNFPVAVWCWNTALAIVCGNSVLWKPSEKTPLCALACQRLFEQVAFAYGKAPEHLSQVLLGKADTGQQLVDDKRIPIISATGSTAMGAKVGPAVAKRFGRSILELGGNNALIVCETADIDMALNAIVFGAVGTAGQRCTTTRRLFIHDAIYDELTSRIKSAYQCLPIGDPMSEQHLIGPLIDEQAYNNMHAALSLAKENGAMVYGGDRVLPDKYPNAYYVKPAIVEPPATTQTIQEETFAPILYVYRFDDYINAIDLQNDVPQGLSSAVFTNNIKEAEYFLSALGSDCGIANVNIGTSGAEIGGAFGGEKATGGGRESGSDAWKGYMRRQTTTVNYSSSLPLAQGIKFDL